MTQGLESTDPTCHHTSWLARLTGTGMMIGTGEFMAPEMLMPDLYSDEYDERVDQ